MLKFIIKRLLYGILVLIGVITIVFFLFNVLPGDPARMMLGQRADVGSIEAINKELGRDQPLLTQFLMYMNDISPLSFHDPAETEDAFYFDKSRYSNYSTLIKFSEQLILVAKEPYLRRSYQTKQDVTEVLAEALPGTAVLAFAAMLIAAVIGIALGVISALKKNSITDHASMIFAVLGMSVPSFFAGIIIAWAFGYLWSDYTGLNMTGSLYRIDPFEGEILELKNLILPAIVLGLRPLSIIVQLTRSSMLDVLSRDYIRTAKSKGLSANTIIYKHALKNALNPVLTAMSGWFGSLLAGAVFVEYIFGWKGVGKLTVDALERYDFPVVMGAVLVVAAIFVIINIITDILYGFLDPRVRVG